MDRNTVDVYERRGRDWIAMRDSAPRRPEARRLRAAVDDAGGGWRVDLGCGGGRYLGDLGEPAVGLDAAATMLAGARHSHPDALLVRGDIERLPFRRGSVAGAWAANSYLHLPAVRLPLALADLQRTMALGGRIDLQVLDGGHGDTGRLADDDLGGRYFSAVSPALLTDLLTGAGFDDIAIDVRSSKPDDPVRAVHAAAVRARSLPDTVGADMRVLTCGLNPSEHAADAGVGFARPGNRFWPAALAAGLVSRDRDPRHALVEHGIGMTDLVKRATRRAADLAPDEYRTGAERLRRLVEWLRPETVCFVGLEGYRIAVDGRARSGWQPDLLAGAPVYLMPSTSGLNAHARLDDFVEHLRRVAAGPPR